MRFISSFLILFFSFTSMALALEIKDVRFGTHPDKTRIVIELSQSTEFKSFVLPKSETKPYRIVVDFPDFEWKAGNIKQTAKTNITDIRTGNLVNGIRRMVIDLKKPPVLTEAFTLPPKNGKPARLVIDFTEVSATIFESTEQKTFGNFEGDISKVAKANAPSKTNTIDSLIETLQSGSTPVPPRKPTQKERSASPAKSTPLRKKIIVIDPGHGGQDPGAISGQLKEKNLTIAGARELKRQLDKTGRYQVYLTRNDDRFLKLHRRVAVARARKADLFISIHADSINKSNVRGASIYTLSDKASDAQTAKLAARENQADLIAGIDLTHEDKQVADILLDLAMRDTMNQSKFLANIIVEEMRNNRIELLTRPHRFAGFAVLKAADVPSVLFEMGFMSNRSEARLLNTSAHRERIAGALVDAINAYFTKIQKNALN